MATNKKAAPAPAPVKPAAKQVNAPPSTGATPAKVETTALAQNAQPQQLASAAPAWLQKAMEGSKPRGFDKMDQADFIIPRIVLAQAMTPEVADGKVGNGDMFDNLSKEVLAATGSGLVVIPVILGKSRFYLGDMRKDEGILCRADDALTARPGGVGKNEGGEPTRSCVECIHKEFDEETGKPACSLFYNVICLLPEFGMRAVVWSCKHTQVKVMKRFLSTAKMTGADLFALKFSLTSVVEKSDKYTYNNFEFKSEGYVSEAEYRKAREFFEGLEGKTWAADSHDIEAEREASNAPAPEEAAAREPGSDDGEVIDTTATGKREVPAASEEDGF